MSVRGAKILINLQSDKLCAGFRMIFRTFAGKFKVLVNETDENCCIHQ